VSGLLVSVVGSANQDMVAQVAALPRPGQTVLGHDLLIAPGGKGLNQAVAAARASASTAFIGLVGTDNAGTHLREVLHEEGVDIRGLGKTAALTGRALVSVADGGGNHIVVVPGANWAVTPAYVDEHRQQIRSASTVLCQLEIPIEAVARALQIGRSGGTRTVLNAAPTAPLDRGLLELVDVLVVNEHEAAVLASTVTASTVTASTVTASRPAPGSKTTVDPREQGIRLGEALLATGCRAVIVTLGASGAVLVDDLGSFHQPGFEVVAVDTTGCGDAFTGALAARLGLGIDLRLAMRWAAAAAALAATARGAVPSLPLGADVDRLLGHHVSAEG
jgi:ribokinase